MSASTPSPAARANRLVDETSPYLLQHAYNPVDWHPWGEEALQRARDENKLIFLSIGYSACHWCHVMERESFENETVAQYMNEHFVNIKVDREERPDLDDVYMKATQLLTGSGGWPMSVWLTPDLEPYYAGTYFPPSPYYGRPSFIQVLEAMARSWETQPEKVVERSKQIVERVKQHSLNGSDGEFLLPVPGLDAKAPRAEIVEGAIQQLEQSYDRHHGGFGGAPKFPHADNVRLLLRQAVSADDQHALGMATHTLDEMARGGLYDQIGGGFARYSVDDEWSIPHFEKMLYDNALLVPAYLEGWRASGGHDGGRTDFLRVVRESCDWVLREMIDPSGGIWSTQDADSEGEEGKYYVWTREQVLEVVGKEHARLVDVAWGLGEGPNFEGSTWHLRRPKPDEQLAEELGLSVDEMHAALQELRVKLFEARERRVRPGTDDKVLVAWNGLMIGALAQAGRVLEETRYVDAARRAAEFCLGETMRPDGARLLATYRDGRAHLNATLADYAYLANGLLDLFEADGDARWPREALALTEQVRAHFADPAGAGFFFTSDDHEPLITRPRDLFDGAIPSSNGVMAEVLVRLVELTASAELRRDADRLLATLEAPMRESPLAFARAMLALLRLDGGGTVVLADGEGFEGLARALNAHADATNAWVRVPGEGPAADVAARLPLLADKRAVEGRATAYYCRGGTCRQPTSDVAELLRQLD